MALPKLLVIAFRDLGRNRRRSALTALAVALGLALLIVLNGYIAGVVEDALQNSIRLRTGHVQIRAEQYQEERLSLKHEDLIQDPEALVARAAGMSQVRAATPVLWASGMVNTIDESAGVRIYGIDADSPIFEPIREAMVAGEYLPPDERNGILMGRRLADSLGVGVGRNVILATASADGQPQEGTFTIVGLFSTGIVTTDEGSIYLPLSKAQAVTGTEGLASAILVMLDDQDEADVVAAALQSPGTRVLTWRDLNQVVLQTMDTAMGFYVLFDAIVILVVAVIIANTLLMAVFERIREVGILAALGMKKRQIRVMFLLEALILGMTGIVAGIVLGSAGVAYLSRVGIYIGEGIASTAGSFSLGTTLHARFVPGSIASLSFWTLLIVLLASLYPAGFAARLQPVEALHSP